MAAGKNINIFLIILLFSITACGGAKSRKTVQQQAAEKTEVNQKKSFIPVFNADTAYHFIAKQLEFGPRIPESKAHAQCVDYLVKTLKRYTTKVQVQNFRTRVFANKTVNGKNIIASFQPDKKNRILLCAHYDSRPFADRDADKANFTKPVPGANDGASGVGVLLEIARHLAVHQPSPGIDIVFFDVEDSGDYGNDKSWALGSLYWSQNPHVYNYQARYGILLDMVGAANPTFTKEATSRYYAPDILNKVWRTAAKIGYDAYFINNRTGAILDDHVNVNQHLNIPTIDIIHYEHTSNSGFFKYWHTVKDDLETIDPLTLKIVGQTVLTVIFEEK